MILLDEQFLLCPIFPSTQLYNYSLIYLKAKIGKEILIFYLYTNLFFCRLLNILNILSGGITVTQ